MNDNSLNVLIVGCGSIAGDLDIKCSDIDDKPLTHAGAYYNDKRFNIKACADISDVRSSSFAENWNIPNAYNSIEQALMDDNDYDVISICSPTDCHYENIKACLTLKPKLIFCEKP